MELLKVVHKLLNESYILKQDISDKSFHILGKDNGMPVKTEIAYALISGGLVEEDENSKDYVVPPNLKRAISVGQKISVVLDGKELDAESSGYGLSIMHLGKAIKTSINVYVTLEEGKQFVISSDTHTFNTIKVK